MEKEKFTEKVVADLERRKINNPERFKKKCYMYPEDPVNMELTMAGAQLLIVIAKTANINYKMYTIDEKYITSPEEKKKITSIINKAYPGIIFYMCTDGSDFTTQKIDSLNNFVVFENEEFDNAISLYGSIDKMFEVLGL